MVYFLPVLTVSSNFRQFLKPEGLLNKPVFKMMIESLMLYVMTFSGANLNNICEKYSPYLQTFSVRELLDVSSYIGD
jgi:hypothetical protein